MRLTAARDKDAAQENARRWPIPFLADFSESRGGIRVSKGKQGEAA